MTLTAAKNNVVILPLNTGRYVHGGFNTVTSVEQVWMNRNVGPFAGNQKCRPTGTESQWGGLAAVTNKVYL